MRTEQASGGQLRWDVGCLTLEVRSILARPTAGKKNVIPGGSTQGDRRATQRREVSDWRPKQTRAVERWMWVGKIHEWRVGVGDAEFVWCVRFA